MRYVLFAVLVAAPTALVTWVLTRGGTCPRPEVFATSLAAETRATSAAAIAASSTVVPIQAPASATAHLPAATEAPGSRPAAAAAPADLAALFASPLASARASGSVAAYDAKGLFDYIDGAAPMFLERGFVRLVAAEMTVAGGGELTCDVYDMGSAAGARGIFDAERSPQARAVAVGDEGRTSSMSLVFRRGRYYGKLTAFDPVAEKALPAVAAALVARLP